MKQNQLVTNVVVSSPKVQRKLNSKVLHFDQNWANFTTQNV